MAGCSEGLSENGGRNVPACDGDVCPCDELGIRTAIAKGGGPYRFACDGPVTVVTRKTIVIDNDVTLDGEGHLTVDGNEDHRVFTVLEGVTAELRGIGVTRGAAFDRFARGSFGGGILNEGTLTLMNSVVSNNSAGSGGGISNGAELLVIDSSVSGNVAEYGSGGGIGGTVVLINSTVSRNTATDSGGGIAGRGRLVNSTVSRNSAGADGGGISTSSLTLISTTVSGNTAGGRGSAIYAACFEVDASVRIARSLVDGRCEAGGDAGGAGGGPGCGISWYSLGYNIESPDDTCNFSRETDLPSASESELGLQPLADYGGPTETHALGEGSVAIDLVPQTECLDAEGEPLRFDQRGEPRPGGEGAKCDVGAFELQEGGT
jgi:predicted outer membrane repeat protein